VDSSKQNDVIELEGLYMSNGSKITVEHDLTLSGKNDCAILDAGYLSEVIYSNASSITLKNIVFKNLRVNPDAIKCTGNLTIINSTFENNDRVFSLEAGNAYFKDVTFKDEFFLHGDNLVFDNCTLDIKNSLYTTSFSPVQANIHSSIKIRNSRFLNSPISVGSFENISIENNEFIKSDLKYNDFYSHLKTFKLKANRFDDSRAEISDYSNLTHIIEDCIFANSKRYDDGGALHISCKHYLIDRCMFINNTAGEYSDGGALYIFGEGSVENCLFQNNTAYARGGAISIVGDGIIIKNNTFTANKAEEGGAIIMQGNNIIIKNNTFIKNRAKSASCIYNNFGENAVIEDNVLCENHAENGRDTSGFYKITFSQSGTYDGEITLTAKVVDPTNNKIIPFEILKDARLEVAQVIGEELIGEDEHIYYTIGNTFKPVKGKNGVLVFNIKDVYEEYLNATSKFTATLNLGDRMEQFQMTIERPRIQFKASSLTLTARSSDCIDLWFYNPGHIFINPELAKTTVKIYKGDKLIRTCDEDGVTLWGHQFSAGTYKIVATAKSSIYSPQKFTKTVTLKVNKMKTTVKAPKVTAKYKKSKYFTITVNQKSKTPVTKAVKIKVQIGKKTYNLKTDNKGVVKINTKTLKVGKYAVKITSRDSNYEINAKSTIIIKK